MTVRHWSRQPRNKYHARKVTLDGYRFDSIRESEVYVALKAQRDLGVIQSITVHPRYELVPKPDPSYYIADFLVIYPDGSKEVLDVKGMVLPMASLKMRLFRHL